MDKTQDSLDGRNGVTIKGRVIESTEGMIESARKVVIQSMVGSDFENDQSIHLAK
jgi:hypothetical protein